MRCDPSPAHRFFSEHRRWLCVWRGCLPTAFSSFITLELSSLQLSCGLILLVGTLLSRFQKSQVSETILTQMMADEFYFLWSKLRITLQRQADADLIPVPGQIELHGRCRCGVLLSPCFGALFVASNCGDGGIRITLQMQRQI